MKLLHLADLHLGRRLNEHSLLEDQAYILQTITARCEECAVDAVLICGDVYDKRVPAVEAVSLLDAFLTTLVRQGRRVFVIGGNHDSGERLHFGSRLLAGSGLHMAGAYAGEVPTITLEDAWGPVCFWLLPYVKASAVAHYHPEADTSAYDAAVSFALQAAEVDTSVRNVLLAHQFVAGEGAPPILSGSETAAASVGLIDRVSTRSFQAFDYVALGHIHRPQAVGRDGIRYAGSPLCYSLSETGQAKSMPLVTLGPKGKMEIELLPLTPRRAVRHITGPIAALLAPENVVGTDDYIYATLTDDIPVLEAISRLRAVYPNTLHLDYARQGSAAGGPPHAMEDFRERSLPEHFDAFYESLYGRQPDAPTREIVSRLSREIGGNAP